MKTGATALFILVAAFAQTAREPQIAYFTHQREIAVTSPDRQNYFDVDPELWSQSRTDLGDLRIYAGEREVPYRMAEVRAAVSQANRTARVLQLGKSGPDTTFVIEVPEDGEYNRVNLQLETKNYVGTATVEGLDDIRARRATRMGPYTIYDFAREGLGANSTLKLPDSHFPYMRIALSKEVSPDDVKGAGVSFREEKKAGYTRLAASPASEQKNRETVISWSAPKNVPLDRIEFEVDQVNFLRNLRVEDAEGRSVSSGEISRVKMARAGRTAESSNLIIDVPGARSSGFKVIIANGDDPPLKLKSITPQYITRRVYFDPKGESKLSLHYGDEKLSAPSYEYARLSQVEPNAASAQLGAGMRNAAYTGRPDDRPWSERNPAVLWAAMIIVIVGLGAVALRGLKKTT
jgi:hypothetical protein